MLGILAVTAEWYYARSQMRYQIYTVIIITRRTSFVQSQQIWTGAKQTRRRARRRRRRGEMKSGSNSKNNCSVKMAKLWFRLQWKETEPAIIYCLQQIMCHIDIVFSTQGPYDSPYVASHQEAHDPQTIWPLRKCQDIRLCQCLKYKWQLYIVSIYACSCGVCRRTKEATVTLELPHYWFFSFLHKLSNHCSNNHKKLFKPHLS